MIPCTLLISAVPSSVVQYVAVHLIIALKIQISTLQLDDRLAKDNYVFSSFRVKGSIGPPEIHRIGGGGFFALREFFLSSTDASANQLKIPRLLRRESAVKFLTSLVQNE